MTKKYHVSRKELETAIKVIGVLGKYANEIVFDGRYDGYDLPDYYPAAAAAMREAEMFARVVLTGGYDEDEIEIMED